MQMWLRGKPATRNTSKLARAYKLWIAIWFHIVVFVILYCC